MKLWQAILIGSDRREQEFGKLFSDPNPLNGECPNKSCALGAAYEGTFNRITTLDDDPDEDMMDTLKYEYPVLSIDVKHPEFPEGGRDQSLENMIIELNDTFHWTRERIALEVVKPAEEENGGDD